MARTLAAVYEKGVLKPTAPLDLPEGTHVELYVLKSDEGRLLDPAAVRARLASIASLPLEPGPEFTAREHDRILYGESARCR
jgi:predicted DNA-binding antitoxin AbrB/MazE fold protein